MADCPMKDGHCFLPPSDCIDCGAPNTEYTPAPETKELRARVAELEAAARRVHAAWVGLGANDDFDDVMAGPMNSLEHVLAFGATTPDERGGSDVP